MIDPQEQDPILKTHGLSYCYPEGFSIAPFSLSIFPGEILLLSGKSGSGKSTILRLLSRRLKPAGGQLIFDGKTESRWSINSLSAFKRRIGIVDQEASLLSYRTVRENLRIAIDLRGRPGKSARRELVKVLNESGLQAKADSLCQLLSLGQTRLVQIALAMTGVPRLILLDEPLAHLDKLSRQDTLEYMKKISHRGSALIIASHDKELLESGFGRVIQISNGSLDSLSTGKTFDF
jgi:cell division transport system ATP-binding protein